KCPAHSLGAVLCLGDHLHVRRGVEHAAQPCSDDRVIVGDEYPCDEGDRHQPTSAGTSSRTSTPPSRPGFTASTPPTRTARSRTPRRPPWPSSAMWVGMPQPSSLTCRMTLPAPGSTLRRTCCAPAWRATFVRLSCATR